MKYRSVCSGVEAATLAWRPLGWRADAFAENERFPSVVLAHHYPDVPNLGDITKFQDWPDANFDVLVGGTPCQSFSVAGLRKGLADPRGNLALTFLGIADRYRPEWIVWENVPGVLSVDDGEAFGSFLGGLAQLGYGFAYRVLDAQFVRVDGLGRAVPQRRRRVIVVGNSRSWRRAGAVLFEPESLSGDPPPSRSARNDIAGAIEADVAGNRGPGVIPICETGKRRASVGPGPKDGLGFGRLGDPMFTVGTDSRHAVAFGGNNESGPIDVATACQANESPSGRLNFASETFVVAPPLAFSCKDHGADASAVSPTLRSMGHDGSHANAGGQVAIADGWVVRRLTPRECERLQGMPDDYTLVPYRGKPAADGPRYKAIGNSMAVNVMRWVGGRIQMVDDLGAEIGGQS